MPYELSPILQVLIRRIMILVQERSLVVSSPHPSPSTHTPVFFSFQSFWAIQKIYWIGCHWQRELQRVERMVDLGSEPGAEEEPPV